MVVRWEQHWAPTTVAQTAGQRADSLVSNLAVWMEHSTAGTMVLPKVEMSEQWKAAPTAMCSVARSADSKVLPMAAPRALTKADHLAPHSAAQMEQTTADRMELRLVVR